MDTVLDYILTYIQLFRLTDLIDILIVAIIIYNLARLIKETRAAQLIKGIVLIFILLQISTFFNLTTLTYIIQATMQVGAFALIVIFQPELRSILERMGRSNFGKLFDFAADLGNNSQLSEEEMTETIDIIIKAANDMSKTKTGALIVLERDTRLGEVMTTGTVLNADVSVNLLKNIFFVNTPLHDGAVIIRGNKIMTAGCFLPLSSNNNISQDFGTRHRAALGISEVSDAFVLIVSEETGRISFALNGTLTSNIGEEPLRKALYKSLGVQRPVQNFDKIKFWKGLKK